MANKLKAAFASIFVNVGLLISKIIAAILTMSVALLAESLHSLFDLFSSILAYAGIKQAEKPEDEKHSFGHEKFENFSSALQAMFITLTALFVLYEATMKLSHPIVVENSEIGIILMIATIPIAFLTARYLSKIAKSAGGSQALEADSTHFTTDVLGSIAVLIGLLAVNLGYGIGDIIAAYAVGIIMLYISFKLLKQSYKVFMDYSPEKETMDKIKKILEDDKRIQYHKLRARLAGSKIFVNVHIQVDKKMTVEKAHKISGELKKRMKDEIPQIKEAHVHIEPI